MVLDSLACHASLTPFQLAVNQGLLAQRSVADAVAAEGIVGHFKHSALALAFSCLDDIQVKFNQPLGRLHQDVQTHQNGMYYMLQSLVKQKWALGVSR